jgi:uncharacterized membrane protein YqjE
MKTLIAQGRSLSIQKENSMHALLIIGITVVLATLVMVVTLKGKNEAS